MEQRGGSRSVGEPRSGVLNLFDQVKYGHDHRYNIEYKTVEGETPGKLDQQIRELIAEEYQPYGNPYMAGRQICQAMIKTNDRSAPAARRGF